ncbi:MAG TPA: flagellar protein FliS, partial [Planctomycetaceae bacterium]
AAFEAADREAARRALDDARAFVAELIGGLDKSAAPEVVSNMAALFTFAYRRLVEADAYGDAAKVRDAAKVLRTHRETWIELLARLSASPAEPAAPPTPAAPPAAAVPAVPVPHARRVPAEYDEYQPRSWCG